MDERLVSLRWHWGSAYVILYSQWAQEWVAQRRDTRETLRADDPEKLRALIVADYSARPVPR